MLEEYKKLTFPSTAACKSDGRKDKVQEPRKKYATTWFQVAEDQNENVRGVSNVHSDDLWHASVDKHAKFDHSKDHYNYVDWLQKLSLPIYLCFYFGNKTKELIKKFPSYYTVKCHCRVYKSLLLTPTVSRLNPIHIFFLSTTPHNHLHIGLKLLSLQAPRAKSDFPTLSTYPVCIVLF